jgi:hypothetical protein
LSELSGSKFRRLLKGSLPLIFFILVSCIFHYRALTEGILIAPENDALHQNYPIKHLYAYALKNLEFPLWNPYVFAGMPFLAEMQNGVLYPLNVVFYFLFPASYAYNLSYVLHFALAGFFTYMYLRLIGLRELTAFAGGMVFGFSGFLIVNKDHTAIVNSAVYLPLLMYFLERLRREPRLAHSLLIALVVAVQIFAGSMQICVYSYMVAGMFLVFYSIRKGMGAEEGSALRFLLMGVFGVLIGICISLPQIISTIELSELSWMQNSKVYRGYVYFSLYHVYFSTLPSLIAPDLFTGWGPDDDTLIIIGILPVIFAFISSITAARRNHFVLFWGLVALLGLVLSLGSDTPLSRAMFHLPVYNTFRAHGRNLLEFTLAFSVLFAIGLETVFYEREKGERYLRTSLVLLFAVLLVTVTAVAIFQFIPPGGVIEYLGAKGFQRPDLVQEKINLKYPAVYMAVVIMAVYIVCLALFMRFRHGVMKYIVFLIMAVEIFYISGFRNISGPAIAEARDLCRSEPYGWFVDEDPAVYRMANVMLQLKMALRTNPSSNLTCRLGSVNAYDPLVLDDYAVLLDLWNAGKYTHRWSDIVRNNVVLGMLGVKYLKVAANADIDTSKVMTSEGMSLRERIPITDWRVYEGREVEEEHFSLGHEGMALSSPLSLNAGTYVASLKARAPEGEFEEYHQVFRLGEEDVYMLAVASFSGTPIEVRDMKLQKLNNYYPFVLTGGGEPGRKVSPYKRVFDDGSFYLYLNGNRLPRAWSVSGLEEAEGIEDVKNKLFTLELNPSKHAMLGGDDIRAIGTRKFEKGMVEVSALRMNRVVLETEFSGRGFVVLSDQHYPGWRAMVDGKETEIYRVNGILRGVIVPEGRHKVEFVFRPGATILLLLLSGIITLCIMLYLMAARKEAGT